MDVVVEGKRYRTSAATLLASGPTWDKRLGNEPRRLLDVRVGGLDLSAIVGGRGWERLGWQAFLFRNRWNLRPAARPTRASTSRCTSPLQCSPWSAAQA
jgi:hypothetical protein